MVIKNILVLNHIDSEKATGITLIYIADPTTITLQLGDTVNQTFS